MSDKEATLLKRMIEEERRFWLQVVALLKAGKSPYDADWKRRGIEVGVDLRPKDKRPWLTAAKNLVDAGIAEWSEGAVENNYLRLASDDTNRLDLLVTTSQGLYSPARANPPGIPQNPLE